MRPTMLLIALALAAMAAHGQAVFRSVMPDGRIVYGDKPAPGAKETKEVTLPPPNMAIPPPVPPKASTSTPRQQAPESEDEEVRSADRDLQKAKAALVAGREPLPGERIGTAGGGSRLTDVYFQRIKALENAVAVAQKKFDDALARRGSRR